MAIRSNDPLFGRSTRLTPLQVQQLVLDPDIRAVDNPPLCSIAIQLINRPDDIRLQELFALELGRQREKRLLSGDAFWANYAPAGNITMGPDKTCFGTMATGDPVVYRDDRVFCGTGVFGRTGSSKSSLLAEPIRQWIDKGYLIVVFQQKDECNDFATEPALQGKVLTLRAGEYIISMFQEPTGVDPREYRNQIVDIVSRIYGRVYAQRLTNDILDKYAPQLPKGMYMPLSELIQHHEQFQPGRGSVESYYKESMVYTLRDIRNAFGKAYEFYSSDFLDKLFSRMGLVTIQSNAPLAPSTFAAMVPILYLYMQRKAAKPAGGGFTPVIFIIEDATLITDERELGGNSPLTSIAFMARAYNIGFVYVNHTISTAVSPLLLSNLESIFMLPLSGEDPRRIQQILNCTPEQARTVPQMQPGEFVAMIPSMHTQPVMGRFPYRPSPRRLTEDERRHNARTFLDTVSAVNSERHGLPIIAIPTPAAASAAPKITSDQMQMLVLAATGKPLPFGKFYDVLKLNRRDGKKTVDSLEMLGLARTHTFSTGKVGGKVSFLEVTDAGWHILADKGFSKSKPLTGGGFLHNLAAAMIGDSEAQSGRTLSFEVDLNGVRIDVESRDPKNGDRIFFNIGVSDPQREVRAIEKLFAKPVLGGNRFILVALDGPFAKQVKVILKAKGWTHDALKRLETRVIADFIRD